MGYKALLLLEKILMALPKRVRKGFFISLGALAYAIAPKYRKIVAVNLDFVFEGKIDEKTKKEITRYSFKNLMLNMMHLMELRHMSIEEFKERVKPKNLHIVQKELEKNRPVVYISAHYGAWEFGAAAVGVYAQPMTAVYKHLKNREYEEWLLSARGRFGNKSIDKTNVLKKLIKVMRNKEAVGILIDTNINKKEGVAVQFFGKTIHQTPTPAFLHRKFDAAIVPVTIITNDEEHYEVVFFDPIETPKSEDEKQDILTSTQAQAKWLENLIRKEPKFWFWLHRRFKDDYPQLYAEI